jgi:hypothetical protein
MEFEPPKLGDDINEIGEEILSTLRWALEKLGIERLASCMLHHHIARLLFRVIVSERRSAVCVDLGYRNVRVRSDVAALH